MLVANSSFHRSTDGGLTFPITGGGCGDCHDIWMDPKDPNHWVATGDGGMGITTNHGESFNSIVLPIGQMYHVAVDNRVPYWIYSNRQDDGTMRGPADSPVPVTNVPSYAPPAPVGGGRAGRGGGCQVIFRTSNGGQSWDVISPDLSTRDPSRIVFSGGVIGDNLGQFYGAVVYAIAPSPIQKGLIWAGTNDGTVKAGFDAVLQKEVPAYNKSAAGKLAPITMTAGS